MVGAQPEGAGRRRLRPVLAEQALARDQLALFSPELREAGRKAGCEAGRGSGAWSCRRSHTASLSCALDFITHTAAVDHIRSQIGEVGVRVRASANLRV